MCFVYINIYIYIYTHTYFVHIHRYYCYISLIHITIPPHFLSPIHPLSGLPVEAHDKMVEAGYMLPFLGAIGTFELYVRQLKKRFPLGKVDGTRGFPKIWVILISDLTGTIVFIWEIIPTMAEVSRLVNY